MDITDGDVAAVSKIYNGSTIYLFYNLSDSEEKQIELLAAQHSYSKIAGCLSVDGSEVTLKGDTVTMPPYSVVILR